MSDRRHFLTSLPLAALALASARTDAAPYTLPPGVRVPKFDFVYECDATLLAPLDFGATNEGHRRVIPITGGTVRGPRIQGSLLNGGADWNLTRNDGGSSVEADYYLRTDDGVLIRIVNRGVSGPTGSAGGTDEAFFMFTTPVFEAPAGPYEWLNHGTFVATLGARKDSHNAVLIRVFQVV